MAERCYQCEAALRAIDYERGKFRFFFPYIMRSPAASLVRDGAVNLEQSAKHSMLWETYSLSSALRIMKAMRLHPEHHPAVKKAMELFSYSFAKPLEYQGKDFPIAPPRNGFDYMSFQKDSIASISAELRRILSGEEKEKRGILLADDMGLGKTIQAIGVINSLPEISKVLIVCPAIMVEKFAEKFREWSSRANMPVFPIGNAIMTRSKQIRLLKSLLEGRYEQFVIVINYELVKSLLAVFKQFSFDLLVLDEAHYVKNPAAQRTKLLVGYYTGKKFHPPAIEYKSILMMTGTPGTASVADICNLANILMPSRFRRSEVNMRYAGMQLTSIYTRYGRKYAYEPVEVDPRVKAELLTELANILRATIMVRRTKQQVLHELPEKLRDIIVLPRSEQLMAKARLERELAEHAYMAIAQDKCDMGKFASAMAKLAEARREMAILKASAIGEYVQDLMDNGSQVVVFCYHRAVAEYVSQLYSCPYVHGEMSPADRMDIVSRFRASIADEPDKPHMIALTMSSCGVGIDIPEAQVALFLEMDWLPSTIVQAEDRLYRIGQKKNVQCQYVVADGTIDQKIAERVLRRASDLSRATGDAVASLELDQLATNNEVKDILESFLFSHEG